MEPAALYMPTDTGGFLSTFVWKPLILFSAVGRTDLRYFGVRLTSWLWLYGDVAAVDCQPAEDSENGPAREDQSPCVSL
jgi:hypothetical protein